ncbi:hypothetical protein ACA910_005876 [Epithemia clementina (nom. ined.)]
MDRKKNPNQSLSLLSLSSSNDPDVGGVDVEPLYITVGPPACGKTFWLSSQYNNSNSSSKTPILDIALDDQPGVYIPIRSHVFLHATASKNNHDTLGSTNTNTNTTTSIADERQLNESWFGRTVRDRIQHDNMELGLVAKRCAGWLTKDELQAALTDLWFNRQGTGTIVGSSGIGLSLLQTTMNSYEAVLAEHEQPQRRRGREEQQDSNAVVVPLLLPEYTDVFVREAIFKPNRATGQSALDAAQDALFQKCSSAQAMAWGNTNTKASDYKVALLAAAQQRRPVYFVVYNALNDDDETSSSNSNSNHSQSIMESELESIGLEGLLKRNLNRYLTSGRYVPVSVLWDMWHRTRSLLQSVYLQMPHSHSNNQTSDTTRAILSALERDQILVRLAGLQMRDNRTIVQNVPEQRQFQEQQKQRRRPPSQPRDQYNSNNNNNNNNNNNRTYQPPHFQRQRPEQQQQFQQPQQQRPFVAAPQPSSNVWDTQRRQQAPPTMDRRDWNNNRAFTAAPRYDRGGGGGGDDDGRAYKNRAFAGRIGYSNHGRSFPHSRNDNNNANNQEGNDNHHHRGGNDIYDRERRGGAGGGRHCYRAAPPSSFLPQQSAPHWGPSGRLHLDTTRSNHQNDRTSRPTYDNSNRYYPTRDQHGSEGTWQTVGEESSSSASSQNKRYRTSTNSSRNG